MSKKKRNGILASVVCVALVVLLILLLRTCGQNSGQPETTVPSEQNGEVTVETTEAPTEEATEEPTEEPTEESTEEPTEEPSEPTGSSTPGGAGGYDPGLNDDKEEDKNEEVEEETVPVSAPGSVDNPYVEILAEIPGTITSVKIPTEGTIYYLIHEAGGSVLTIEDANAYIVYGETTYRADSTGVVTVDLTEVEPSAIVSLQVGNSGKEEVSYALNFGEPVGGATNPEIIDSIEKINTTLKAGDQDGYRYLWTADQNGTLRFAVSNITDGTACNVIVTVGDTTVKLSDSTDGAVSLEIVEGDEVTIQVIAVPNANGEYPAIDVELAGEVTVPEDEPIVLHYAGEPIASEEVPAGDELRYQIYGVGGMTLTIADPDAYVIYNGVTYTADASGNVVVQLKEAMPMAPTELQLGNAGAGNESYMLTFAYPVGHQMNPAELILDADNEAVIVAGNDRGYYWTYTAEYTGTLQLTLSSEDGNWVYNVNNLTAGSYGDSQWSDSDPAQNPAEIPVTAGDELQIMVNTYDPMDMWNYPAGTVTVFATYKAGSCEAYPITLLEMENNVTNEGILYYQGYFSDTIMTVSGTGDFNVIYDGQTFAAVDGVVSMPVTSSNPRMPVVFAIEGDGDFAANFAYPAGSMMNPAVLVMGDNIASIEAGNSQGYYFTWTADSAGALTITMPNDMDWNYVVNNMTSYVYGDTQWSDSDPVENPVEIIVSAGEEIQLIVNTYNPADMWNNPAGDLVITAEFTASLGTEENPVFLGTMENTVTNTGTMYYQGYFDGTTMTVTGEGSFTVGYGGATIEAENGVVSIPVSSENPRMPVVFTITGDGTYAVNFAYPVGTMSNPAQLVIGENIASVEASSQGYYFTWTAEKAGNLTITMPAGNWTYTLDNTTTGTYGETQWSDSDPVVNPAEIFVSAGNKIQLVVNTYDPADEWNNPAGELVIDASFAELEAYVIDSKVLKLGTNSVTLSENAYTTIFEFTPEETGVYLFEVPETSGAVLGYWGAGSFFVFDQTEAKTNTLEYELTSVGPSIMVGVTGSGNVTLTITKKGDAQEQVQTEYTDYENKHTPDSAYNLLTGEETMVSVDITVKHSAVLGTDGYYHLDSADGSILYVNFVHSAMNLYNACYGEYGASTLRGKPVDNKGYDYLNSVKAYADAIDSNNYYPLTEDLITFFKDYGAAQAWAMVGFSPFAEVNEDNFDADTVWMALCVYPQ